jgi:ubiquinol-cytochrome c reductase cytochrome c1 subunit
MERMKPKMFRKITLSALAAATVMTGTVLAGAAWAEESAHVTPDVAFSFEGPFGTYDQHQLQRGLQVYTEVCSACHGLKYVPIRTLGDEGGPALPEDQVRAYAATLSVVDKDSGEERAGLPADHFPANTSAGAPDLSLMAKARAGFHGPYGLGLSQLFRGMGGPEYIVSVLHGYSGETKDQAGVTFYENAAFTGGWISMPPPLEDGQVEFADGAPNDVEHMAEDVSAFLMWAAEPHLNARKATGFKAVIFLGLLSVLLYLTNKRLWAGVKGKKTSV